MMADERVIELASIVGDVQIALSRAQDAWQAARDGNDPKYSMIEAGEYLDGCKERIVRLLQWEAHV